MSNEALWAEFKKNPSIMNKRNIMLRYTNLVHYVIQHSKFAKMNVVDEKDFFQFGIEGLSEAIDRFDPDYGTKFETYAIQRIRGKIIDELRKLEDYPKANANGEYKHFVSLNQPFDNEDGYMLYETIPNGGALPDHDIHKREDKQQLVNAIKRLNDRDRLIISLYYYENLNYKEIAEVLNITVSRVSQIHSRIIDELKKKITQVMYE